MLQRTLYTLALCFAAMFVCAQAKLDLKRSNNGIQYGLAVKAQLEFSTVKQTQPPHIRVAVTGGIGSSFIDNNIYPTLNTELQLYNNGLGSSKPGKKKPGVNIDLVTALTLTAGIKDFLQLSRQQLFINRNVPLYYFADFGLPALKNPFAYSFSIGTNFIFNNDPDKQFQRTGFVNFHFNRFQLSYSNDGGVPVSNIYLGDRKDRYYTGSVLLSYHGRPYTAINLVELSYHKFTGYTQNAFEASNQFDFAYVNYKKTAQRFYNKSLFTLTVANPVKGCGVNVKLYNKTKWDVQHLIHWSIYNSYHIVPYKEHLSFSGTYYLSQTTIGLK
ncbi:polymorphic toxin type 23 domain-containing protein [Ferruginibacter sp. SUN106]|uniref:polymorphic toxin type 23 domain-containing protein n=1 Tax=Ferruginibacter sp. SUN106 TaxID=2978348 RepID=UPI003D365E07